jgi:hypothetical protein
MIDTVIRPIAAADVRSWVATDRADERLSFTPCEGYRARSSRTFGFRWPFLRVNMALDPPAVRRTKPPAAQRGQLGEPDPKNDAKGKRCPCRL